MHFDRVAGRSVVTTRWACGGEPEGVTPPDGEHKPFYKAAEVPVASNNRLKIMMTHIKKQSKKKKMKSGLEYRS